MYKENNLNAKLCILVFLVGALIQFDVTLIARVPLGELLAFGSIPFLWRGLQIAPYSRRLTSVILVLGMWALGILLSDMFNLFIFERFVRGFMKPAFSFCWMLFFAGVLLRDYRALLFYPVGRVLAALQNYVAPRAFTEEYMQSGGYEAVAYGLVPIIVSCSLAVCVYLYRKHHLLSVLCFLFSGAVLLFVGSPRSSVALQLLNAAIVFYLWWGHSRQHRRKLKMSWGRLVIMVVSGLVCCFAIYYVYVFSALQGWLGELQYTKINDQQQTIFGTSPLGLVLGGRTYVFAAILGIIDKPFLGHGSWTGFMMANYYFEALQLVGTDGRDIDRLLGRGGGLAGHSVLFQGWLENGILAATALIIIAYWTFRQMLLMIQCDSRIAPLFISSATSFSWAFLFSPFGVGARITIGLFLALHLVSFFQSQAGTDSFRRR